MNSVHLILILIIGAATLFLVSSVLVSALFAFWIRMDSLGGDFSRSKRKINVSTWLGLFIFVAVFSILISSAAQARQVNLANAARNVEFSIDQSTQAIVKNLAKRSMAFTGALAQIDMRLLRYSDNRR